MTMQTFGSVLAALRFPKPRARSTASVRVFHSTKTGSSRRWCQARRRISGLKYNRLRTAWHVLLTIGCVRGILLRARARCGLLLGTRHDKFLAIVPFHADVLCSIHLIREFGRRQTKTIRCRTSSLATFEVDSMANIMAISTVFAFSTASRGPK